MTTTNDYRPGSAAPDIEVRQEGDRYTLVFVRELRHPPSRVWEALTDPEALREWAPFDADRNLASVGEAKLTLVDATGTGEDFESEVRRAEEPSLLEYTLGGETLRWELEPTERGTRLTLFQSIGDRTWLPKVAAGWHICLDVAERALDGAPIGRIVAEDARRFEWERLNAEYAEQFGVPNTGWPEKIGGSL